MPRAEGVCHIKDSAAGHSAVTALFVSLLSPMGSEWVEQSGRVMYMGNDASNVFDSECI